MKVYVLSYRDCTGKIKCADGIWGAFDSLSKAEQAIYECMRIYDETLITTDEQAPLWRVYTNKSIYRIEAIVLNDFTA